MTDPSLIERLAALPTLAAVPRAQLEWLVEHGEILRFQPGESLFTKGQSVIADLWIVLEGRFSIQVDRGGINRTVKEWTRGGLSGYLPYSRLRKAPSAMSTPTSRSKCWPSATRTCRR